MASTIPSTKPLSVSQTHPVGLVDGGEVRVGDDAGEAPLNGEADRRSFEGRRGQLDGLVRQRLAPRSAPGPPGDDERCNAGARAEKPVKTIPPLGTSSDVPP